MTALTESKWTGEYLLTEAAGTRARDVVTIKMGQRLEPGTVLGRETVSGLYRALDLVATDGTEAAAGILYAAADALEAAVMAVAHVRACEVKGWELIFPAAATSEQITAIASDLARLGIIVRW